jgi:hypothetical protein
MKIYFHDNLDTDQRLPHEGEPATMKDLEELGVFASYIEDQSEVDRIAEERGYKNRDEVCARFKRLQLFSFCWRFCTMTDFRFKFLPKSWEKSIQR